MKHFVYTYQHSIFALITTVIVLWQLLLPGYVLLLDWVPGPRTMLDFGLLSAQSSLSDLVSAPSVFFLAIIQSIMPASALWLVQKIILISLVFMLFYLPLRFSFAKALGQPKGHTLWQARYFTALLFAFNPFIYERLLSGQWRVAFGYALSWVYMHYLLRFVHTQSWGNTLGIYASLLMIGAWSIHFLIIDALLLLPLAVVITVASLQSGQYKILWRSAMHHALVGIGFIVLSGYWLLPYMQGSGQANQTLNHFSPQHQVAFATAQSPEVGVLGNVMTLRGFWPEAHMWATQFILPGGQYPILFYAAFCMLFLLVCIGLRASWRLGGLPRNVAQLGAVLLALSIVFATGISAYVLWMPNQWLFDNISFWSGFRDTQKWSGITAILYAIFGGLGVQVLLKKLVVHKGPVRYVAHAITVVALAVPVALVPMMPFGLGWQVQPTEYPASWAQVNALLSAAPHSPCKALYVPWHQYYAVSFNNGQLIANPANNYFDCDIITGHNTELWGIGAIAGSVQGYNAIEQAVTLGKGDASDIAQSINTLQQAHIGYIIVSKDLMGTDAFAYPWLASDSLQILYDTPEIALYILK